MIACPPSETLAAILSGTSTAATLSNLDEHLATCTSCRQTLDELSGAPRLSEWMAGDPRPFAALERIGRYRIDGRIGSGGMGVVYRAFDDELKRSVALKVLRSGRSDPADDARFLREARAAAGLRHDHLVPVHGIERTANGHPVLVMPLIHGPSLKERLRADPAPTAREAAEWIRQVADGLSAVHDAGLVHRDVKPANVLIDSGDARAKLTDFGLVRAVEAEDGLTRDGVIAGTPEYLSPEQAAQSTTADARSDVYSLGITLYECLAGVAPFRGPPLDVLARQKNEEPIDLRRLNPLIPSDLATVCLKCIEKSPEKRYPSAAAVRDDLDRFLTGRPILARPAGAGERAWRWAKRNPLPVAIVAVAVIGFAASASGWWRAGVKAREAEANAETARMREAEAAAARTLAEEKANLAEERSRLALSAITTLVTKAQTLIGDTPGTLALRRQLNEAALADLRQLAEATANVPGADRTTVAAHLKLGDTYQLLGQTDDAVKQWTRAAEIARELVAKNAQDHSARCDLARAHCNLGFVASRTTDFPSAARHLQSAVETLEEARRHAPEEATVLSGLAVALSGRADVEWFTNQPDRAFADFQASIALNRQVLARDPADASVRSKLFHTMGRIGYLRIAVQHEYAAAGSLFQEQIRIASEQLAKTPSDRTWQSNLHVSELDLSSALQRQGDAAGAERAAQDAITWLEQSSAAEPDNAQRQRDLASGHTHLGLARIVAGRYAEAEAAFSRAYGLLLTLASRPTPASTVAFELPALGYALSVAAWRQGHYEDAAKRMDQTIAQFEKLVAGRREQVRDVLDKLHAVRTAVGLTAKAMLDPEFAYTQPADVAPILASLQAVASAMKGDETAARNALARLAERFPRDVTRFTCQACLDGLAANRTSDPEKKQQFVQSGAAALIAAVRADRSLLETIHLYPELVPIRTDPGFRKSLADLLKTAGR